MTAPTKRLKTKALPTPRTRAEAEELLHQIGIHQREVARINSDMNDDLSEIKRRYEEQAQPHNDTIAQQFQAVHAFCEANRDDLLTGKLKSARMATGEIGWRTTPPKVMINKVAQVIEAIKALGHKQFLRTKEEINKDAMLADEESRALAGSIKGITIKQTEEFFARPFESDIEQAETVSIAA